MSLSNWFKALTGFAPYNWQIQLFESFTSGNFPQYLSLPTGAGKTSVIPIWLLALAHAPLVVPRRIVWIVNRRVVVDQATQEAEQIRENLEHLPELQQALAALCAGPDKKLAISTLRGQRADNREWSDDASRPAIVIGTVDMIGSRLLFSGYGDSFKMRPRHAGLLGHDALLVNDEAHLTPAFAKLLETIEQFSRDPDYARFRPFHTIRLSATQNGASDLDLQPDVTATGSHFQTLWTASKRLTLHPVGTLKPDAEIANLAAQATPGTRTIAFVRSPETAQEIARKLKREFPSLASRVLLLTGEIRGHERDQLVDRLRELGFMAKETPSPDSPPAWLISTSAGEVGANFSCERLFTELDTADHLLQRFGRLNRFAEVSPCGEATVVYADGKAFDARNKDRNRTIEECLKYLKSLPEHPSGLGGFDISPGVIHQNPPPRNAVEAIPPLAKLARHHVELWSQTTLHRDFNRKPEVASWLHGEVQDTEPDTEIVWRARVPELIQAHRADVSSLVLDAYLEYCPIRPHERLKIPTRTRLVKVLTQYFQACDSSLDAILVDRSGETHVVDLRSVLASDADRKADPSRILNFATLILPKGAIGLENGHLTALAPSRDDGRDYDVSASGPEPRLWELILEEDEPPAEDPAGYRTAAVFPLCNPEDPSEADMAALRIRVQTAPRVPEPMNNRTPKMYLDDHTAQVAKYANMLAAALGLEAFIDTFHLAALHHDSGKRHPRWQYFANGSVDEPLAKSFGRTSPKRLQGFRHEFQSLAGLEPVSTDALALHLVASHHGCARPGFPEDTFVLQESRDLNLRASHRFAQLTRQFGPWALAWLEAAFHTADSLGSKYQQEVHLDA